MCYISLSHHTGALLMELKAEIRTITPDDAAAMLAHMVGNRPLRNAVVRRFAREMLADAWRINGEPIIIANTGKVLDGQHRLNAIIMAEKPVRLMVVEGVPEEFMPTIDTGAVRTFADVLTIEGKTERATNVAAAVRLWWRWENGLVTKKGGETPQPSHQELEEVFSRHPQVANSAGFIRALSTVRRRCMPSVQTFVHSYLVENIDGEVADLFLNELDSGAGLTKTNAIYRLRRRLVEEDVGKLRQDEVLALTIKAYNAWVENIPLSALSWRSGEDFPQFGKISVGSLRAKVKRGHVSDEKVVALKQAGATKSGRSAKRRPRAG
jgi:hypothetical protein